MRFDRETYIEMIADKVVDSMNTADLEAYVFNTEVDYLSQWSDSELMERAVTLGISFDDEFGE